MPILSVLDLAPVIQGATPADALRNSLDLAQHAERWNYKRYWLASCSFFFDFMMQFPVTVAGPL